MTIHDRALTRDTDLLYAERVKLLRLRQAMEDTLEHMIELLDRLDGDPDFEPTMANGANDPRLDECEPDADLEPSLGSINPSFGHLGFTYLDERSGQLVLASFDGADQRNWSAGSDDDREQEHDGREPEQDSEASVFGGGSA